MANHVHLLVQCGDEPLATAMKRLFGRYAQWFNRRRSRVGHLYQERHKALVVDSDDYLKSAIRYIHLNPVDAQITNRPDAFTWSSHRAYIGMQAEPEWLTTQPILGLFNSDLALARAEFHDFVVKGQHRVDTTAVKAMPRSKQLRQIIVPDDFAKVVFWRGLQKEIELAELTLDLAIQKACAELEIAELALCQPGKERLAALGRAILALKTRQLSNWTMQELAIRLKRNYSSLSKAATQLTNAIETDESVSRIWNNIWE